MSCSLKIDSSSRLLIGITKNSQVTCLTLKLQYLDKNINHSFIMPPSSENPRGRIPFPPPNWMRHISHHGVLDSTSGLGAHDEKTSKKSGTSQVLLYVCILRISLVHAHATLFRKHPGCKDGTGKVGRAQSKVIHHLQKLGAHGLKKLFVYAA